MCYKNSFKLEKFSLILNKYFKPLLLLNKGSYKYLFKSSLSPVGSFFLGNTRILKNPFYMKLGALINFKKAKRKYNRFNRFRKKKFYKVLKFKSILDLFFFWFIIFYNDTFYFIKKYYYFIWLKTIINLNYLNLISNNKLFIDSFFFYYSNKYPRYFLVTNYFNFNSLSSIYFYMYNKRYYNCTRYVNYSLDTYIFKISIIYTFIQRKNYLLSF